MASSWLYTRAAASSTVLPVAPRVVALSPSDAATLVLRLSLKSASGDSDLPDEHLHPPSSAPTPLATVAPPGMGVPILLEAELNERLTRSAQPDAAQPTETVFVGAGVAIRRLLLASPAFIDTLPRATRRALMSQLEAEEVEALLEGSGASSGNNTSGSGTSGLISGGSSVTQQQTTGTSAHGLPRSCLDAGPSRSAAYAHVLAAMKAVNRRHYSGAIGRLRRLRVWWRVHGDRVLSVIAVAVVTSGGIALLIVCPLAGVIVLVNVGAVVATSLSFAATPHQQRRPLTATAAVAAPATVGAVVDAAAPALEAAADGDAGLLPPTREAGAPLALHDGETRAPFLSRPWWRRSSQSAA